VTVLRPAWLPGDFIWDGGPGENVVEIEPFSARAVHITGDAVASDFETFVDMAMTTELNSLMIDLKDESGVVFYDSTDPTAIAAGAVSADYSLSEVVSRADSLGLYLIGRLVIFQDPVAARSLPEMAVWDSDLNAPYSANGQWFLDPTDPDARDYAMSLAVEACNAGVDEIQFDYVRFPSGETVQTSGQLDMTQAERVGAIEGFLEEGKRRLHSMGCAVSADVFGIILGTDNDQGIGQRPEELTLHLDAFSPMVYPSHYSDGWIGFDDPNEHPYDVTSDAIKDGLARIQAGVILRPWLQAFWWTDEQIRRSIQAAEDHDVGWILWNAVSNFSSAAIPTDAELVTVP
jgi:hypothetical protein